MNAMHVSPKASHTDAPRRGYFGRFGGQFVPETLMPALAELEQAYDAARADPAFGARLAQLLTDYVGRPTPLYHARRLSESLLRAEASAVAC